MFTVPWEIERWSPYETGVMNEPVIQDVIDALYAEGMREEAERLRPHWERKVRTFVVDRPDLFRSEYAFDSTGFEATHALAKYALQGRRAGPGAGRRGAGWVGGLSSAHQDPPGGGPGVHGHADGRRTSSSGVAGDRLLPPGGGHRLGTVRYMSQLGGWAVLDYALHHAEDPGPVPPVGLRLVPELMGPHEHRDAGVGLRLLVPGPPRTTGRRGVSFEATPYGQTWLGAAPPRGPGTIPGEDRPGFCGALGLRPHHDRRRSRLRPVLLRQGSCGRRVKPWRSSRRTGCAGASTPCWRLGRLHLESEADRFALGPAHRAAGGYGGAAIPPRERESQ